MSWRVERSDSFNKWWAKENIHDGNYPYHKRALQEFQNISLPHSVQVCLFKNSSFECWETRLPDKIRQQGKSGCFRVILIIDLEEQALLLQGIFRRAHLGWKGSIGKYDEAPLSLIKALAQEFIEPKK